MYAMICGGQAEAWVGQGERGDFTHFALPNPSLDEGNEGLQFCHAVATSLMYGPFGVFPARGW
jgi:hypothetical protein